MNSGSGEFFNAGLLGGLGSTVLFAAIHFKAKAVSDLIVPGAYGRWMKLQVEKKTTVAVMEARGEKVRGSQRPLPQSEWDSRVVAFVFS